MNSSTTTPEIRPFRVEFPQADLDDLRQRLERTRYAPAAPGDSWDYGTPVSYLRDMVERWKAFDWRAVEASANAHPNFLTEVDGQTIHFIHVRSEVPGARPLLLAHTYPGSFLEFLDMIEPLTDPVAHGGRPEDAFHVVVPSMPGFGFSTPLVDGGWTMARVARAYDSLMRRLGYDSYGTHGSDGGAMVSRELAILDPEGFLGAHVLQLFSFPSGAPGEMDGFGEKEYAALGHLQWFQSVGGYNSMNGTRPQTDRRRPGRLARGRARLQRAVRELRQRHQPGAAGAGPGAGHPLLVDEHLRHRGALPLRGGALRGRACGQPGTHRGGRVQGRLPDDSGLRRAGQREHRALVGVPARWALRRARGARDWSSPT